LKFFDAVWLTLSRHFDDEVRRAADRQRVRNKITRNVRMERPQLDALASWIAEQPNPKPSRPEAIRRLLKTALQRPTEPDR
jgi:hypothetical protein